MLPDAGAVFQEPQLSPVLAFAFANESLAY
jgi:hypothetical protein